MLRSGQSHTVDTCQGSVRVQLLNRESGDTRIDLCRNGMWITDDKGIPGFYHKFQDLSPFHALLLLDPSTGGHLYDLVRSAESPLHDKMTMKYLPCSKKRNLKKALEKIREWLRSKIPRIGGDSYIPDDFLALKSEGDAEDGSGNSRASFWGTPPRWNIDYPTSHDNLPRVETESRHRGAAAREHAPQIQRDPEAGLYSTLSSK